ncbi:cytoplasmic protein [Fictibacillus phosphorivorans]|uniref:cytoplasmic protein n=1 Tax=Fictibacillus phosphorivorans TaxID=1221500 RepID=UPI002040E27D|nr:cytoplasmic protein [Fictibacillus phosphorivorans]MCM3718284.1 cytoplasmic protein [Fictibacillus phosphorivorans]MCM3775850.1 cytoplasmic protein [Fictibacillus phosphorivorans]
MQTQQYSLVLHKKTVADTVKKQCKMCRKVTTFTDTTIRRHNANGKNIYQFAIYKCPKNHTWNKKLTIYKSFTNHVDPETLVPSEFKPVEKGGKIPLQASSGESFEIHITGVEGSFRLDRTLADHIEGWSRSEIVHKIKSGSILLNDGVTKPSQKLSVYDKISISIKK